MIAGAEVERTLEVVRRSGISDDLENLLRPVGQGRKRRLSAEALFVALLLTVKHKQSLTLVNVHAVLTRDISVSKQLELGYRRPGAGGGACLSLRQVRYLFSAIAQRLETADSLGVRPEDQVALPADAEPLPGGEALQTLLDKLLAGTMPAHVTHEGAYAVDETVVWAWARGKGPRVVAVADGSEAPDDEAPFDEADGSVATEPGVPFDPDARWGYKTALRGESPMFFGYGVFAFARIAPQGQADADLPLLTERVVVRSAATDVVEPILSEIDRLLAEGLPVTEIVADRAWSYKASERWAQKLRDRGIEQTLDMHKSDAGPLDHEGMALMSGVPHCPFTPDEVRTPSRPMPGGDLEVHDAFFATIERREAFALRKVANADDKGRERWQCPAVAGKVRCSRRPESEFLPLDRPAVAIPASAKKLARSKCCSQQSVTVPITAQGKLRQKHYWGSPEWTRAFARRTYVEGVFGNWRNRSTENVNRGWTQVVGLVKTSIMVGALAAAANIRLLRVWAARTRDFTDPVTAPDPVFFGFEELTVAEVPAEPGTDPPVAV